MRVDKTWTITFNEIEQERFRAEAASLDLPADWGRPLTLRIIGLSQITLPTRAIERLIVELDIARTSFLAGRRSRLDFRRHFPTVDALYEELNIIVGSRRRRSA
ncbi:MAG: hypothetical protein JNN15_09145 [Blastocatellia bacterium]|nr:hypothetical protein [Blastocatellia bacterium]